MARVEEKADVRPGQQPLDLRDRLDARVHVVMEHRLEAARASQLAPRANTVEVDLTVARAPVAEHSLRVEAVEQVERGLQRGIVTVAEAQLDEGAGQREARDASRSRSTSPRPR